MLRILGKASSINVRKVLWTCAELDLPFELEQWGAGFKPTDTPAFLALNPNAMVPVIQDDDFTLWESNSIIRYLATRYGDNALYPAEARARARVDQWIDWQASDLNSAWRYAFLSLVRRSPQHQDHQALRAACLQWSHCMGILERQLQAAGGYVAGPHFSLADIPIGLSVNRWLETPYDRPLLPAVNDYYQLLGERPGFRRYGCNGTP
ncbi:glutathione S-transferase family protein [Aeromonas hydrophila]|uniref:glutathione S-transferase family protein n=1 Tax=Aeromonas hydrophila TaxID=644 RepID=UPI001C5BEBB6|nr:glutathione S-transferase [Aeromonas hydrophila]MBW3809197.1 glutathione S-transferase [Aeromonas hydrophila]